MERNIKGLAPSSQVLDGKDCRIAIISTRWNVKIIQALKAGATKELVTKLNVTPENIHEFEVPGAYELPFAAQKVISSKETYDAVICIGCLIKGSTVHFEYIADSVTHGLQKVGLDTGVPVIFGVLTCLTEEQAQERSGLIEGRSHNHGIDWANAAIQMAQLSKSLR